MGFHKILVALDFSPFSTLIFERALELAKANGAMLRFSHSLSNDILGDPVRAVPVELGFYPELMGYTYRSQPIQAEKQTEQARAFLQKYCEKALNEGVKADFECQVSEAGQYLCQSAHKWGADLVVLGRRGRTGLTEALMGSVSNYVLHHAPCSVLVIQGEHPPLAE